MADKELDIKINLNISDAKAAAEVMKSEMAKVALAAEKFAWEKEQAEKKAADRAIAEARREAREREKAAVQAAAAQEKAAVQGVQRAGELGTAIRHAAAQFVGFQGAQAIVSAVSGAFQAARDRSAELARQVIDTRDALREIAAIKGVKSDTKLALKDAEFQAATGLRADESIAFQTAFQGSGAQFIGKTISEGAGEQFERDAAALAAKNGLNADVAGDLAGSLIGFTDFKAAAARTGQSEGDVALGQLNRGLGILGRGKGRNSVLANQLSMLAASMVNEDEMKGVFSNIEEAAVAISVGAEKHDAQAFEIVRTFNRATTEFDGEQGETLKAAGLDANTKPFERARKLAEFLQREAVDKGAKPEAYLAGHGFTRMEDRDAIMTFINRGVEGGVIADRLAYAGELGGANEARADIKRFQEDPEGPGAVRVAEAQRRAAELRAGVDKANQEALRQQAVARLTDRKEIDTTAANAEEAFFDKTSPAILLGLSPGYREEKIDAEMQRILRERAAANGVHPDRIRGQSGEHGGLMAGSEEAQTDRIKSMMAGLSAAGVNPITGEPAGPRPAMPGLDASPLTGQPAAEALEQLRQINRNLERPPAAREPIPVEPRGGRPDRAR